MLSKYFISLLQKFVVANFHKLKFTIISCKQSLKYKQFCIFIMFKTVNSKCAFFDTTDIDSYTKYNLSINQRSLTGTRKIK